MFLFYITVVRKSLLWPSCCLSG